MNLRISMFSFAIVFIRIARLPLRQSFKSFEMLGSLKELPALTAKVLVTRKTEKFVVANVISVKIVKSFITYAKEKGIEHHILNANKGERIDGIYHIQHINAYHSRFRKWIAKFQGVATKYINHYLECFRYTELHKRLSTRSKKQDMLVRAFINSRHIATNSLKPCYAAA